MSREAQDEKIRNLERLYSVGIALSSERNRDRLLETILLEAKSLCNADGGSLYLRTDDDHLKFVILRTDSLKTAFGGTTGTPIALPPIPMFDARTGTPNDKNVATSAALLKRSVNIPDAYDAPGFDFSGTKAFDQRNNYRSKSLLAIPLVNSEGRVIGVLQLLNAMDPTTGVVVPFAEEHQRIAEALASQAGIALDNQLLLDGQRELLESFIKAIASAIDSKSPHTGAHCERVPILTEMLAQAVCDAKNGTYADFRLDDDEWYELRIAAWMHDCGKVTTPVHVMDKSTKLEALFDRIEVVRARFEVLKRDAEIAHLRAVAAGADAAASERTLAETRAKLDADLAFLENANIGGEFLEPEKQNRIGEIGRREYFQGGAARTLLTRDEIRNLAISRGTLNPEERLVINGHMVQTIKMLEALPFPRNLRRVPEYASGHHEKMDGTGYPRGVFAGDMSIPARIMAIADVFEALTAQDRPYKGAKRLSETMRIMGFMKRDNHLDPDLFDLFISSGVYREYAKRFLPAELVDEVDEGALLGSTPKPFKLPDPDTRAQRQKEFLLEYRSKEPARQSLMQPGRKSLLPTHRRPLTNT
ncbi:MAG TPA: HD domain-containing phosphohydrolase [Polyangiaceae bacterium]|jgi:HD-GYP domain-containing protein (c-di-GMP phosphodiesterase class II)|nr:HD domain-containing phosphohydrolase [Polyangiaceae bacterium]